MLNKVENTKKCETFNKKAKMMNIEFEKQVQLLNDMYKDKGIRFKAIEDKWTDDKKVTVYIYSSIEVLELPEFDYYNEECLVRIMGVDGTIELLSKSINKPSFENFIYRDKLVTLKLPKSIKKIDFDNLLIPSVRSLWLWDTTEIKNFDMAYRRGIKMIVIRSETGKKPQVYKI